jgi:hypothetical protein
MTISKDKLIEKPKAVLQVWNISEINLLRQTFLFGIGKNRMASQITETELESVQLQINPFK